MVSGVQVSGDLDYRDRPRPLPQHLPGQVLRYTGRLAPSQDGHTGLSADPCRISDPARPRPPRDLVLSAGDVPGRGSRRRDRRSARSAGRQPHASARSETASRRRDCPTPGRCHQPVCCGNRFLFQVGTRSARSGPLALRAEGDLSGEVREEVVGVEVVGRLGNGQGDRVTRLVDHRGEAAESSCYG